MVEITAKRFANRKASCSPEMLAEICSMLSQGYFRSTIVAFLKIGADRFNNWLKRREFREAIEHAEACYFKGLQERWLAQVQDSLPEAKEYAKIRFPETLQPGRAGGGDGSARKVTVIVKKYNAKGARHV